MLTPLIANVLLNADGFVVTFGTVLHFVSRFPKCQLTQGDQRRFAKEVLEPCCALSRE